MKCCSCQNRFNYVHLQLLWDLPCHYAKIRAVYEMWQYRYSAVKYQQSFSVQPDLNKVPPLCTTLETRLCPINSLSLPREKKFWKRSGILFEMQVISEKLINYQWLILWGYCNSIEKCKGGEHKENVMVLLARITFSSKTLLDQWSKNVFFKKIILAFLHWLKH